mgnify:CR=1 FL=1
MLNFIFGIFSNIALFNDLILTEKNRKKLRDYYEKSN